MNNHQDSLSSVVSAIKNEALKAGWRGGVANGLGFTKKPFLNVKQTLNRNNFLSQPQLTEGNSCRNQSKVPYLPQGKR